jgi:uncharacterized membrane protein YfcA
MKDSTRIKFRCFLKDEKSLVSILEFTILVLVISLAAGFLGSLTGLGGGMVIVPLLTILFGVDIRYAIGASLVSVIATSSGAAAAYVREGYTNIRLGMFLEIATTFGAVSGAYIAGYISTGTIAIIFGAALLYSAYLSIKPHSEVIVKTKKKGLVHFFKLTSEYPTARGKTVYSARAVPGGFGLMYIAGILSGLLGIGSGAVKVLAMDQVMRIPFKVSTTTSNFMIGVTAAASVGIYLRRGYVDPALAMPVMLGVLTGAMIGTRILVKSRTRILRILFGILVLVMAIEMIYKGISGGM